MADLIEGVVIRIAGKEWTVPPLTFRQLRRLQPQIELLATIGAAATPQQIAAVSEIVHAALSRNYPALSTDDVEEMLDLGNAARVISAILRGSGLNAGEAKPGSV
jgi:hypothetical protein